MGRPLRQVRSAIACAVFLAGAACDSGQPLDSLRGCEDYSRYTHPIAGLDLGAAASGLLPLDGGLCAAIDGNGELAVLALDAPEAPRLLARLKPPDALRRLYAMERLLVGLGDAAKLQLIDLADPAAPRLRGTLTLPGWGTALALQGSRAWIACPGTGVCLVDLADVDAPQLLCLSTLVADPVNLVAAGDRLYVADWEAGLHTLDISAPCAPVLLSQLPLPIGHAGMALLGERLLVQGHHCGLAVLDLADPDSPTLVWQDLALNDPVGDPLCAGEQFTLHTGDGLTAYRLEANGAAVAHWTHACGDPPSALAVADGLLLLGVPPGLLLVAPGDQARLEPCGIAVESWLSGVAVTGDRLCLLSLDVLEILDIENPAAPRLIAGVHPDDWFSDLAVDGDTVYLAGPSGLAIVDITHAVPALLGEYRGEPAFHTLAYREGLVALARFGTGETTISLIDVSDPLSLIVDGTLPNPGWNATALAFAGEHLFYARDEELRVGWVRYLDGAALVATRALPAQATALAVRESLLYLVLRDRLQIFDISVPQKPALLGETILAQAGEVSGSSLALVGDRGYLVGGTGLLVMDIGDPAAPRCCGALPFAAVDPCVAAGPELLYLGNEWALFVAGFDCAGSGRPAARPLYLKRNPVGLPPGRNPGGG